MGFPTALKTVYSKYANFYGRAPRSEFWWFMLYYVGVGFVLDMITPTLANAWDLAHLLPQLAVTARRLHDTDRSGWWQLLPLAGLVVLGFGMAGPSETFLWVGGTITAALVILLTVWLASPGTHGPNRHGDDPFDHTDAEVFS